MVSTQVAPEPMLGCSQPSIGLNIQVISVLDLFYFTFVLHQPVFATAQMVSDFAEQFVKMEAENAQLLKDLAAAKASTEQAEASRKMAEEAWQKNEDLEKELAAVKADLDKEVKLRETMKAQVEKRENQLRKSIESLLGTLLHTLRCFACLFCKLP